jgi:hypothetical protein
MFCQSGYESLSQGCQMAYFHTKNPNLGKFWRALDWKMFIYFMAIRNIGWIFYDHLLHFVFMYMVHLFLFGIMYQEKSGSPGLSALKLPRKIYST